MERQQCTEMRCRECLRLHDTEAFNIHECVPMQESDQQKLREVKKKKVEVKEHSILLNELQEIPSENTLNPRYRLHFMIQDRQGRIYGEVPPLDRTLSQILGLTQTLAKREKENDIGRSAQQMLQLLLDPASKQHGRTAELRRISLQHFLNEILSSFAPDSKAPSYDHAKVFFSLSEINNVVNHL